MSKEWIAVIASPRRGENTERLVDIIIKELNVKGISVRKYYLDMKQMWPCTNCEYCIKAGRCYIDDEISFILNQMINSEGIILASPSYNYNVTGQMKILMDRSFSLNDFTGKKWSSRLGKGKKAIVASVCKGKDKEAMGYTSIAMKNLLDELEVEVLDVVEYYDTKYNPVGSDLNRIEGIRNKIKKLF